MKPDFVIEITSGDSGKPFYVAYACSTMLCGPGEGMVNKYMISGGAYDFLVILDSTFFRY